jgi:RimJ/RimL family protein N-acetyltransferase
VELRPLDASDQDLLRSLEQQDDVWEFVGTLPLPGDGPFSPNHLFTIIEHGAPIGIAGLVRSGTVDSEDFELLCALRSEAQLRGFAKQACTRVLAWAFDTAGLQRVIASIDSSNEGARALAVKLGMTEERSLPTGRTVYAVHRDARRLANAAD